MLLGGGDRADVLLGDHEVGPPALAGARLGLAHIAVDPERVDVQLRNAPPVEAGERLSPLDGNAPPLLVVERDALRGRARGELVEGPAAHRREPLAEVAGDLVAVAGQLAVEPVRLLAVGVADVVHLDHELEADPLLPLDDLGSHAVLEAVAPGLAARRAAAHLLPIAVEGPALEVARLDLGDP